MDQLSKPAINSIHLVGSIPLPSAEETLRAVASELGARVKRIPDGEPGERQGFVYWQLKNPIFLRQPILKHEFLEPDKQTTFTDEEIDAIIRDMVDFETGYDTAAIESYQIFKQLQDSGIIHQNTRFLVSLPTPIAIVGQAFRRALMAKVEPIVESHMLDVVRRIQDAVPLDKLAIQWDCPIEFAILEDREAVIAGPGHEMVAWFEPAFEGVVERLVRLGEGVGEGVELGYHFCYGDGGKKHFLQPHDTGLMADVGQAIFKHIKRPVNWIHLPVPKYRTDVAYFEPLRKLVEVKQDTTEIYLGLMHEHDLEGTKERVQTAKKIVPSFGVATECGMGRRDEDALRSTWQIAREVVDSSR